MNDQNYPLNTRPIGPLTFRGSGLLTLVVSVIACSGNSNLGGSTDAKAGTGNSTSSTVIVQAGASHSNTGGNSSMATNARGGAANTLAGSTAPTTAAVGGSVSTGTCTIQECFRNVRCVTACGGPAVQDGCCSCPSGSFDSLQCDNAGGASASGGSPSNGGANPATGGGLGKGGTPGTTSGAATSRGGGTTAIGTSSKGGAVATGGTSSTGIDCNAIECFRAINCVATCGGPVLQSGCCPCPSGTFDSISCSASGGAGGAAATGGATSRGGATAAAGTSSVAECKSAEDCHIVGDCCGCHSLPLNQGSSCEKECLSTPGTCGGFDPQPTAECRAGRCVLSRTCDDSRAVCKRATPQCDAGKLPTMTPDGTCWEDNCIDIAECSSVSDCSVCKDAGLMCVEDNGVKGVFHCVEASASCASAKLCSCFGDLCGTVTPCFDLPDGLGIGCGGG